MFEGNFENDVFKQGTVHYINHPILLKYEGEVIFDETSQEYIK